MTSHQYPPWRRFWPRVLLSVVLVPLVAPLAIVACLFTVSFGALMRGQAANFDLSAAWGVIVLYGIFSLAGLVALGMPLLLLYRRMGWNGWLQFALGGAGCALATTLIVAGGNWQALADGATVPFVAAGLLGGVSLRAVLGLSSRPRGTS